MRLLLSALVALSPAAAFADTARIGVAKCAVLSGDLERLECYDTLAKTEGVDGPKTVEVDTDDTGDWVVQKSKNPIDDSETVVAYLIAENDANRRSGGVGFYARCKSNKTEVYINWNDYLGDDSTSVYEDWKYVVVRIGDAPSEKQKWDVSTDNEATFAPSWSGDLLKSMLSSSKFVVQTTPYAESPTTAIFNTTGMEQAIKPIRETCNW